jgi:pyroglutamyl-peptidase
MSTTLLITGFGPFPGTRSNPSGPLALQLAHRRRPAFGDTRCIAHVFPTSYAAVERELPELITRHRPHAIVMFGLAPGSRNVRIETQAHNAISRLIPDMDGVVPRRRAIRPGASARLAGRAPMIRLLAEARLAGVKAVVSRNAGRYLCNYLYWRAIEATAESDDSHLVVFIHIPKVRSTLLPWFRVFRNPRFDDLLRAGEGIVLAVLAAARRQR